MNIAQQIAAAQKTRAAALSEAARHQPRPRGCGNTRTQELIDYIIQHGLVTTKMLCREFGIESRQVWGMLKTPRDAGKIAYLDGAWAQSDSYDTLKARAAAEFLEGLGWICLPPAVGRHA